MTVRRQVKRIVEDKAIASPDWVKTRADGSQYFQHPENADNPYNGKDVEDATLDVRTRVMLGEECLEEDFTWDSVKYQEAEDVETLFKSPFPEFIKAVNARSAKAERLLMAMLLKRLGRPARLGDTDVLWATFRFEDVSEDVTDPESEDPSSGAPDAPDPSESEEPPTSEPSPITSE